MTTPNVVDLDIHRPSNLVITHLCDGSTTVVGEDTNEENIALYLRMARASILGVDAAPLLPEDADTPPGPVHVTSVTWFHNSLVVGSRFIPCSCEHTP